MRSTNEVIRYSWNRISRDGRRAISIFSFFQIVGLIFDGLGLLFISKSLAAWSQADEVVSDLIQRQILSEIGIGMACLIARGLITIISSRHTLRSLEEIETTIALENYRHYQAVPWERRSGLPLSTLIELIQESPFVMVYSVIFNLVASGVDVVNLLIVAILIIYMNPLVALSTLLFFLLIGSTQHFFISKLSEKVGENRQSTLLSVYDVTGMAHRASKVLQVMKSKSFAGVIENKRRASASAMVETRLLQIYPRATLELALSAGGILVFLLTQMFNDGSRLLPNLVLFLFAGFRIVPILSHLQSLLSSIISESAFVVSEMNLFKPSIEAKNELLVPDSKSEQPFIELVNVSYKYPGESAFAIDGIDLRFEKGKVYSIVGDTGSGKSTLFDVCLGVLEPTFGHVKKNTNSFGYVPQNYEIFSGSTIENISLEWDESCIDFERLNEIKNQLANFPEILNVFNNTNLPVEYSGGQKQIVNVLRALYRNPEILLLDEATSALDNNTESQISSLLQIDKKDRATIVIAHRISTIQESDMVIFLESGKIKCKGSFDEIRNRVPKFEEYIRLGNVK